MQTIPLMESTMSSTPILQVRNLTCVRSRKPILRDVSFCIHRGEYISLVGPNGAGKSTLLKCLLRILPVERGTEIQLNGKAAGSFSQKELAQTLAYIPQSLSQTFAFTVRQFVAMGRFAYQKPWAPASAEDEAICREALAKTGLEELAERPMNVLSGGELQRAAIAAALAQQAEMLLLDESLSQLDYRCRQETANLLHQLCTEGKTILLVSHDLNYAMMDADRILALADGQVRYDGPPEGFLQPDCLTSVYGVPLTLVETPVTKYPVVVPNRLMIPDSE